MKQDRTTAWLVGLGSSHGDDRVGWEVIARLRESVPPGVRAEATGDPLHLLNCPADCGLLIVVDACHGAGLPGTLHRFVWPDSRLLTLGGTSSHGIGLMAALELAATLGRLPPRVVILAIEGIADEPGEGLNHVVEAAIPAAVAAVLTELAQTGGCE